MDLSVRWGRSMRAAGVGLELLMRLLLVRARKKMIFHQMLRLKLIREIRERSLMKSNLRNKKIS